MFIKVTERMFRDKFIGYNNFTSEGLTLLFNYFDQLEQDTGEDIDLDVVSICCDYSEMTFEEFANEYGLETEYKEPLEVDDEGETVTISHKISDEDLKEAIKEYLQENTVLVGFTDETVVYMDF